MDFDIHEDARTEGVALGAAPFLMCGWKARREEVRVTVPLHVVFAEDVDQWKANDPFTEIWVVMPWDVDADAFHEVADWLDSRCRFNE